MEWKEVRLGEIASMKYGKLPPKDATGPIPVHSGYRIVGWNDKMNCKAGTVVVIARGVGGCGDVKLMKEDCFLTNLSISVEIDESVCLASYFYYLHLNCNLAHLNSGSAQPQITIDSLSKYTFKLPPIATQRRISSILSSLDRKIELNNKINATLEELAQTLFKSWFVDFEPFKNGKFIETEIGEIPEGLSIALIQDIPHLLETGRRPKGGVGTITSGVPSVGAEHVKGMGKYDFSKTKYIPAEYASTLKSGKVNGYELLIYKDGGKPGYFIPNYSIFGEGYPFDECYLNEHVFKLDFEAGKWFNIFCYFYFQTDYVMNYLNAQGGKAAIPGINQNDVRSLYIFTPENDKVQEFGKTVFPLFTQILKNLRQNTTLTHLRDTLLPRLMSGEIEV